MQGSLHATNGIQVPTVQSWERKVRIVGGIDRGILSTMLLSLHVTLMGAFLESTVLCRWPRFASGHFGGPEKSRWAFFPLEHLHSWEKPKELSLFISSETTLSGYLITVLKYLHRETI